MASQFFPCRDSRSDEEREDAIFQAASTAICDFGCELAKNYDEVNPGVVSQLVVGRALVCNGIIALAAIASNMDEAEVAELIDDVVSLIGGRIVDHNELQVA